MKERKKKGECPKQQIIDPPTEKNDNVKVNNEISLIDNILAPLQRNQVPKHASVVCYSQAQYISITIF